MNYAEFKNKAQTFPVIFSRDLLMQEDKKQALRNQLERWCAKKLLIKLRRGVFLLNPNDRKIYPSEIYIANQLYSPSYVSMEFALGFYGLIPEAVFTFTSVTTRKTLHFRNEFAAFAYQHIKPQAFRGFKAYKDKAGLTFFVAEPEKALVDFIYLNLEKFFPGDEDIFNESYRLQNTETLNKKRIMLFAGLFGSRKLVAVCKTLCSFIEKEDAQWLNL